KKVKGKFRVDTLNPDLLKGADIDKWLEVYDVLSNSEMPPDDEADYHLAEADRSKILDWLGAEVRKASQARRHEKGHSSFRRMARYEYNNALQDLLGLPYDFVERLVTETISEDGFKNSSEHLNMTAMLFENYREIGLQALKKASVSSEQVKPVTYSISMQKEMEKLLKKASVPNNVDKKTKTNKINIFNKKDKNYNNSRKELHLVNQKTGDAIHYSPGAYSPLPSSASSAAKNPPPSAVALVLTKDQEIHLNLGHHLPDEGIMRISIRAARSTMNKNEYASLRLIFSVHPSYHPDFTEIISKADIPVTAGPNKPQFIHFYIPLSEIRRNPFRKNKTTLPRREEVLTIKNIPNAAKAAKGQEPLEVLIDHIEISGPYYEQWPPKTHTDIFIKSKNKSDEKKYCRQILKSFMIRCWRRPLTSREIARYAALFTQYRPQFTNFKDTMHEVLATVLASPEFLYITQKKEVKSSAAGGEISELELANRLSFFLWSSLPDVTLIKLAHQKKLNNPKVLLAQVKRLLADARGQRFSQNFVPQWLGLGGIDSVSIDRKIHRSYKPELQQSMLKEPLAFFSEVLKSNSSIMDFIHSDYAMLDERLA
ncbi:MAG: DUF1592 domain-containing protein, partial [Lentisphaeraceae bacterium]|nr:DUF1592 domain-containing protein [Lentisphaeraceae bacterium]